MKQDTPPLNNSTTLIEADLEITEADKRGAIQRSLRITSLNHTFENFKHRKGTEAAVKAFEALADGTTDKPFLFCYGTTGCGKTHLIDATIIRLYNRGILCRYLTTGEFLALLKGAMTDKDRTDEGELFRRYCTAPYLILDDLGLEYGTKWEYSRLEELIRCRDADGLVTIITTNKDFKQLVDEGNIPRLLNRFRDPSKSQLIFNAASSYRERSADE